MAANSTMPHLLLALQRLFSTALKVHHLARALSSVIRRLALWWGAVCSRRGSLGKGKGPNPLPSSRGRGVDEAVSREDGLNRRKTGEPQRQDAPYTMVKDGEVVSLENAAFSLNPYSSGIRNASRSSQSIQAARSSHNLSIVSHNASRSSQHLGSEWSQSANSEEEYTFTLQRTPTNRPTFRITSPTPRRQFSTSLPELQHHHQAPFLPPLQPISVSVSPSIEVFSPGGGAQAIEFTQSQSPTPVYFDNRLIIPVMPEGTNRYSRRSIIGKDPIPLTIEPLKLEYVRPVPPQGWTKNIHPEGARYFYHKEKRIYTEANLLNASIYQKITDDVATIDNHITSNNVFMPETRHLVIDTDYDSEGDEFFSTYYFVDHESRTIFFLDSYDANDLSAFYEVSGCKSDSHLGHEIQAQYWYFVQLYPDSVVLTSALISELRDVALHFVGDTMTSPYSTSPYSLDDLYKILTITSNLEKNIGLKCIGATSILGRLLYIFCHAQFHNFHGEACARIERNISVYGTSTTERTWLVKILSVFLFSAPDVHLRLLQKMWVDGLMHKAVWENSVKKMNEEWQEFILFATVLLNANVAFLAIQSIDVGTNGQSYRSPTQVSSYLSIIASVGSIIIGLLLIRQNRTKNRETANDVSEFMQRRSHPLLGLETLAILQSLPYALLMWGMVSFLIAFCCMCFENTNPGTRVIVGSACVAIAILVAWCVWSSWETQPEDDSIRPHNLDDDVEKKSTAPSSKAASARGEGQERPASIVRRGGRISRWMQIFEKLRKGSLDSQRTVV